MDFLYPKFNKETHKLKESKSISLQYPTNNSFENKRDLAIQANTKVCVIEENIGFGFLWSHVIVIGTGTNEQFYTLSTNLINTGGKETFTPIRTAENTPDVSLPELDPNTKEIFVPYIDKKNGYYSVRIQSDYEKVLDSFVFENLLHDIFFEGVSLLLASRGFKSDNAYIQNLVNKYYTFAYINNDLDLSLNRGCEPLTFTVSIPLSFFNEMEVSAGSIDLSNVTNKIILTNANFKSTIDKLLNILTLRISDINALTYPNKFIENFIVDFETVAIRKFAIAFSDMCSLANYSLSSTQYVNSYEIGLDNDLNIIYIKFSNAINEKFLDQASLASIRLKGDFNSKRIFNYLLNLNSMGLEISNADIKEFIFKYVKYPEPKILTDTIFVNGNKLPEDKAEQFLKDLKKSQEECVNISDITTLSRSLTTLTSYTDPLYHIFIKQNVNNLEEYSTFKSFLNNGKSTEEALKLLKERQKAENLSKNPDQIIKEKKIRDQQRLDKESAITNSENDLKNKYDNYKNASIEEQEALDSVNYAKELVQNANSADEEQFKKLTEDLRSAEIAYDKAKQKSEDTNKTYETLQKNLEELKSSPLPIDQKILEDEQQKTNIDSSSQSFVDSLKNSLNKSFDIKYAISNGFQSALQTTKENDLNLSTLIYVLNRININEILFEKLFCWLKGLDPNAKETAEILSQIPLEILNYFNYVNAISQYKGNKYIEALEKGLVPDIKLYCSENNGLVYFVKGLTKFVNYLNSVGSIVVNVKTSIQPIKVNNPYDAFIKSFFLGVEQALIQLLLQIIKDLLNTACEDPIADNNDNIRDPFSSTYPNTRFGGISENNNRDKLKNNRNNVLDKVYFEELRFGFDREYTVDLIGRLLSDINCILTPQESVSLLRGSPSDVLIVLVKNLIKTKYSQPPNDLTFLLRDEQKLKQFFKELGLTVDPEYLDAVTTVITNYQEPSQICTPSQLKAREELINGKVPKDLGTLERQIQTRTKNAKVLFDRIRNGETNIDISPLCPDFSNSEVESVKDSLLENFKNSTKSVFSNVLSDFTDESKQLSTAFTETRQLYRVNNDGNIFDSAEYKTFYRTLDNNLKGNYNNFDYDKNNLSAKQNVSGYRHLYKLNDQEKDIREITNINRQIQPEEITVFCKDNNFKVSQEFLDYLTRNDVLLFFNTTGKIKKGESSFITGGEGVLTTANITPLEINYFNNKDVLGYKSFGTYLSSKRTFIALQVDASFDENKQINISQIKFYLFFNNQTENTYQLIDSKFITSDKINLNDLFFDLTEDKLSESVPYVLSSAEDGKIVNDLIDGKRFVGFDLMTESPTRVGIVYVLSKNLFDIFNINIQQFLEQDVYEKLKGNIIIYNNYLSSLDNVQKINKSGIFQSETLISTNSPNLTKNINITRGVVSTNTGLEIGFINVNFASWKTQQKIYLDSNNNIDDLINSDFLKNLNNKLYTFLEKDNLYFKNSYFESDFIFTDKAGKIAQPANNFNENLTNQDYLLKPNNKSASIQDKLYSKYGLFDYPVDNRFKRCNIYPHYLNLDYILDDATDATKPDLCDLNNYDSYNILKTVLVELTFRTHITDLLIKGIPYLSKLSLKELKEFHNKETYIDILREFFKRELKTLSPDANSDPSINSVYYKYFSDLTKQVYKKYKETDKLKQKFVNKLSFEIEIDYFIKKESYRFIKYCLEKGIFSPSENSVLEEKVFNSLFNDLQPSPTFAFYKKLITFEFESLFGYILAANTIDATKKAIYYAAKSDLASIFFSNAQNLTKIDERDIDGIENSQKSQEDVVRFLTNLEFSPSPALMITMQPSYGRYIKTFLLASLNIARSTLSTIAEATDPNISITKKINLASTFAAATAFTLMSEEAKLSAILSDPTYTLKRLYDGRSIVPDAAISLPLALLVFPTPIAWTYLAVDTIQEALYYSQITTELVQNTGQNAMQTTNPCAIDLNDRVKIAQDSICTPDSRIKLKTEINSMENTDT